MRMFHPVCPAGPSMNKKNSPKEQKDGRQGKKNDHTAGNGPETDQEDGQG